MSDVQIILKKGDLVTVEKWVSHFDRSYVGDVLEVKVVQLPFVLALKHTGILANKMVTLSLNEVKLMHLSKEFTDLAMLVSKEKSGQ